MVIRPPARRQVATARPSTRANGRNKPLVVTMLVWPARISTLDDQPCRSGSNGPASVGGKPRRERPAGPVVEVLADPRHLVPRPGQAPASFQEPDSRPLGQVSGAGRSVPVQVAQGQEAQGLVVLEFQGRGP